MIARDPSSLPGPRLFDDQQSIFGPNMTNDWSGSIVYEWIEEANHYGLISYGPPVNPTITASNIKGGFTRAGTPIPISPDFENLRQQWAAATPTGIASSDYDPRGVSTRACPTSTAGGWLVNGDEELPPPGKNMAPTLARTRSQLTVSSGFTASSSHHNPAFIGLQRGEPRPTDNGDCRHERCPGGRYACLCRLVLGVCQKQGRRRKSEEKMSYDWGRVPKDSRPRGAGLFSDYCESRGAH